MKYSILIVDDEPDIIEFLSYSLQKEGFEVLSAPNGLEALKVIAQHTPNLILLDVMMPEMDGIETCIKLREQPALKNCVIAFLTARGEDYSEIAGLDAGGDDYIEKPIKPRVLISRIKALLRRREQAEKITQQTIGSLIINFDTYTATVEGVKIDLAKKEFELLTLLASNPQKVFTRDTIFRKIWGADSYIGTRTIDVHIKKLRNKLGQNYIKTIKGIGYQLQDE